MKRLFALLAFLIYLPSLLQAQTTKLVGYGDQLSYNAGTIFAINDDGTNPKKWMDFKRSGNPGSLNLIESDGKFYGVTKFGGSHGYGVIFSLDNDGTNYTAMHDFDSQSRNPHGSLVEYNGKLWGVAHSYEEDSNGEIFNINLDGMGFSRVHEFETAEEGLGPVGGLVVVGDKFWGMTIKGGTEDVGVIFNLDLDGTNYTKVHDFDGVNGGGPNGRICYSNDKIWGMTVGGGTTNSGVLFSLDLDGTNFIKHHDFEYATGVAPYGSLVEIGGELWGTAWFGGSGGAGVVFNLDLDGTNYSTVVDFDGSNGVWPTGDLVESNGKVWGTTYSSSKIFNLDLDGSNYQVVRNYWPTFNGVAPKGGLLESNGKLWGVTDEGGVGDAGVVFNVDLENSIYTKVHDFESIGGVYPIGTLIQSHDQLWGVTMGGGTYGDGVIFNMNRDGSAYEEIYQFEQTSGYLVTGSLLAIDDKLWGTVRGGGPNGHGGVFCIDIDGANYVMMHAFINSDQFGVRGILTIANNKIWGTISTGSNEFGYIYNMNLDGTDYAIVHSFDGTNGSYPAGNLVESNGKLWGLTAVGGVHDFGVIYNMNLEGSSFTIIHEFDGNDGARAYGNYLVECQGKLWGITEYGGINNNGVIFSLDTNGANYNKIFDFNYSTGAGAEGGLVESNNKLWGVTKSGGLYGFGAVFSFGVDDHAYTNVLDLGPETVGRANFRGGSLLAVTNEQTIDFSLEGKSYGEEDFSLVATGNTNNSIAYTSSDPSIISISGDVATVSGAGEVTLTASQEADDWYFPASTTQTIQVSKAELSVTADDQSIIYGASPSYSYQLEGFVNGDDASLVDVVPSGMSTLDPTPSVGEYAILVNQDGSDNNYGFNYIEGNLSVLKASLTAGADNQSKIYGGENPELSVSYTGFVNEDSEVDLDTAPALSTVADVTSSVGTYDITVSEGEDNNYEITETAGSLSIDKASLTASADDQSKIYGGENPELSVSYTGFVNEDSEVDLDTAPALSTVADVTSSVGTYDITVSEGEDNNYEITETAGSLSIGKASLSASADDQSKIYGEETPELSVSYTGFVNEDSEEDIDTAPTLSTGADATSSVGDYEIAISEGLDNNYEITETAGSLSIDKASLTAIADDVSKIYGGENPELSVSYTGFVNEDSEANLDTEPASSTVADATSSVGFYEIAVSEGVDDNYEITETAGSLSIDKASLVATADNQSKIYGEDNPDLSISYTGFVNGDSDADLDTPPASSTVADVTSSVGFYEIAVSEGVDDNYEITETAGSLSVDKASLTARADDASKIYGGENPELSVSYTGFVNGDSDADLDTPPASSTVADVTSSVGTYDITVSEGVDDNYEITETAGSLSIDKASLTATADDASKIYGEETPELSVSYTGFVNEDSEADLDTEPASSTVADATSSVGFYEIAVSEGVDDNYEITETEGSLSIYKASLTARADDQSKIYGGENPELSVSYTGFMNGDSDADLDTPPASSTVADVTSSVGVYDIAISEGIDDNYEITETGGSLTVEKAMLTIMANDLNILQGSEIPELTLSITGFVNNDEEGAIDLPEISTIAIPSSEIGEYSVTLTGGGSMNYDIVLVDGLLTIEAVLGSFASLNKELMVYPNPVSGYFKLPAASPIVNITILNLSGRIVKQFDNNQPSYDISDLPNGAYVLTINKNGEMKTVRIIKE